MEAIDDPGPAEGDSSEVPTEAPPSTVTALPGLVGYDIREDIARAPLALADESEDVVWAEETEDLILAETSDLLMAPNSLVALECRTTWCGIVVDVPDFIDTDLASAIGDRLGELFSVTGIARYSIGSPEGGWVAVYVEIVHFV